MIIKTASLDKAAFYLTLDGDLDHIEGKYPDNIFYIDIHYWLFLYELIGGWVSYNRFCNYRRKLKRKTRKMAGLPEYFTGHTDTPFKLGDIAVWRSFTKSEKAKLFAVKVLKKLKK